MGSFARRQFLTAAGVLLAVPFAQAQRAGKVYRMGFLTSGTGGTELRAALLDSLRGQGYAEGRNLEVVLRHGDGSIERLPAAASELVGLAPDIIVTSINATTRAALKATRTIPIVMVVGTDVIGEGFVASLARPRGNVTGLTFDVGDTGQIAKRFEFLKEAFPRLSRIAALWDAGQDAANRRSALERGAAAVGAALIVLEFQDDLGTLFAGAVRQGAQALITGGGGRIFRRRKEVVALAEKYRLPDIHYTSQFVEAGGLMSYAPSLIGNYRRAAAYVGAILKGASPAVLPVEQPTRFELVVNLKAARMRGLTLPQSLLVRADRVLES